jgi:uncharacterized protein (TIGR02246 family)
MHIDRPNVVEEISRIFERYERALVDNDLEVLDELFWDDGRTVRFGFGESLRGHEAIARDRRSRDRQTSPRSLRWTTVTTFGTDVATVTTEFVPNGSNAVGRQSQTWVRLPKGWRVVSAHVSWEGGRPPA